MVYHLNVCASGGDATPRHDAARHASTWHDAARHAATWHDAARCQHVSAYGDQPFVHIRDFGMGKPPDP